VLCKFYQFGDRRFTPIGHFRMNADRSPQMGMCLGERQYPGKIFEIDADARGTGDLVAVHQFENLDEVFSQFREIKVAMRINEHQ